MGLNYPVGGDWLNRITLRISDIKYLDRISDTLKV